MAPCSRKLGSLKTGPTSDALGLGRAQQPQFLFVLTGIAVPLQATVKLSPWIKASRRVSRKNYFARTQTNESLQFRSLVEVVVSGHEQVTSIMDV